MAKTFSAIEQPSELSKLATREPEFRLDSLTLPMVQALVAVRDYGSIGQAARALGRSQPTVSQALVRLENLLEITLVQRSAIGSGLTNAGFRLAAVAEKVLVAQQGLVDLAGQMWTEQHAKPRKPRLQIAASYTVAEQLLPAWLADMELVAQVEVCNSAQVQKIVLSGKAELGFVEGRTVDPTLSQIEIGTERLLLALSAGHPLLEISEKSNEIDRDGNSEYKPKMDSISLLDMLEYGLVVREPGSGVREVIEIELARRGWTLPATILTLNSTNAVLMTVASSRRVAVVSPRAAARMVASGEIVLRKVKDLDTQRSFRAIWLASRPINLAAKRLVTAAQNKCGY